VPGFADAPLHGVGEIRFNGGVATPPPNDYHRPDVDLPLDEMVGGLRPPQIIAEKYTAEENDGCSIAIFILVNYFC
jgi:hypothetical protein